MERVTEKPTTRLKTCVENLSEMNNVETLDEETIGIVSRIVLSQVSTKHINIINLWMRQQEIKKCQVLELAGLMGFEEIKEFLKEKSLERRARRYTHFFTKKWNRMLYEEIDNVVWSGKENEMEDGTRTIMCLMKSENEKSGRSRGEKPRKTVILSDSTANKSGKPPRVVTSSHTNSSSISLFGEYRVRREKCPRTTMCPDAAMRRMAEWKVTERMDEETNWLLGGRTVLIYKGGDRKDPSNFRPKTCLPTITKIITLAIHKSMR